MNAEDIRDLKPWAALSDWGFWLAVAIGTILLLAAAFWLWRRLRRRAAPRVARDLVPPGPSPEERLRALDGVSLADAAAIRLFHFEFSECFRGVLEAQFGFPATDRTTEELRASLRGVVPDPGRVVALLEASDLVKFTDYRPSGQECRDLLAKGLSVVEGWKPKSDQAGTVGQFAGEGSP